MRLGILGGTFNPPHYGHLQLAEAARKEFALERTLLMVTADPPHKPVETPSAARLEMTALAAEGREGIEASGMEIARGGKSYTVETLRALGAEEPDAELFLIVGEDMLKDLPRWREAESIFRMASIVGMERPGESGGAGETAETLRKEYGAKVFVTSYSGPDISSTEIRKRFAHGLPAEGMLPEAVERHIYEKGYYFPEKIRRMQENLSFVLKKSRYRHTMGVVRTAAMLCEIHGGDPERVRLAALLHDCAKRGDEEMPALAAEFAYQPDEFERESPGLMHGPLGALTARREYGIRDEEILSAIRFHTTGHAGMTTLEKIVAVADITEPGRDFPGVDELRALSKTDLDAAMRQRLASSLAFVKKNGRVLHPRSLETLASLQ